MPTYGLGCHDNVRGVLDGSNRYKPVKSGTVQFCEALLTRGCRGFSTTTKRTLNC